MTSTLRALVTKALSSDSAFFIYRRFYHGIR
nr:MAG TPA: hypothetical protein [Caudoviricetes sp.]